MKIKAKVYLKDLKEINRVIEVNNTISLQSFCEYILISMNCSCKNNYELLKEGHSYLKTNYYEDLSKNEEIISNQKIKDLKLKEKDKLTLYYELICDDLEFIITIESITNDILEEDFKVISGNGTGILESGLDIDRLKQLLDPTLTKEYKKEHFSFIKGIEEYYDKEFNLIDINNEIRDYINKISERKRDKRYIINVSLNDFTKEIKRKISVNSNITIDNFCRAVVLSMNGDLSHSYGVKIGKEYLDEGEEYQELNYLDLKEKQKFKVIYDFGDNWIFNASVSKIIDGYSENDFEVLSGKGYGIIDDCGGTLGLADIFSGENKKYGNHAINDFDLEKCNERIREYWSD